MSVFLVLVALNLAVLALDVKSQTPQPRNVEGRVFTNSSNGVQNGIPVRINSTTSLDSVLVHTDGFEEIPELRGVYSSALLAVNGETIYGWAWNSTYYGTNTTTIQGGTTNLNFILNITRPSEANVTILGPLNDSFFNKSVRFNITANISMMGASGIDCNATIKFFPNSTLNITPDDNLTHFLDGIPLFGHKVTNWSVAGLNPGSANVTVRADCASDGINLEGLSADTLYNLTFQNLAPQITRIAINNPIDLAAGANLSIACNATIFEANTASDIKSVNATLFLNSAGNLAPDDNNDHYTNSSCSNISSSEYEANYSCTFSVAYYASNGSWKCNMTAADYSNAANSSNITFTINELLAINVFPNVIDFGKLSATNISDDVNITVRNYGNIPINASVFSFAPNESLAYLNLSMTCPIGNITNNNTRFSVNNGTPYDSMQPLNNVSRMLNFSLQQRTDDLFFGNDTNSTFWKIKIPVLTLGACNGSVVFMARAI